jgi:small-conductance mechanosensitive channel
MEQVLQILRQPLLNIGGGVTIGQVLEVLALILGGLLLMVWVGRLLRNRLEARGVSADLVQVIARAYFILALVGLFFITLNALQIPLTAFAFVSGAIAIGVGFGAQNIINNFISGWILMWERPIKIGDFLDMGDVRGTVESINTRSTRIRRVDGVHLLVPNSFLLENTIINWTLVDKKVRTSVIVGVAYGSDVKLVRKLLEQAADEQREVLRDPQYIVYFDDFGDSALVFELSVWTLANADRGLRVIRSDLRYRIDELFAENDVVIAFPQRDIHVDGALHILDGNNAASSYTET